MNIVPRPGETVSSMYNASLPTQSTDFDVRRSPSHGHTDVHPREIESLKKELNNRDSTITELKNQLKNLQSIVEQLTKENSVLKTSSIDDESVTSLVESTNGNAESKPQERGKSLDTELTKCEDDAKQLKSTQRPVSMYETREGPKNNWQVTKHQVLIFY